MEYGERTTGNERLEHEMRMYDGLRLEPGMAGPQEYERRMA